MLFLVPSRDGFSSTCQRFVEIPFAGRGFWAEDHEVPPGPEPFLPASNLVCRPTPLFEAKTIFRAARSCFVFVCLHFSLECLLQGSILCLFLDSMIDLVGASWSGN